MSNVSPADRTRSIAGHTYEETMPSHPDDYRVIRSIAVTASDVVMAYETNQSRRPERAVIRLTPPFNGRMRARLHLVREGDLYPADQPPPIHIDPADLVGDVPALPHAEETEAELRRENPAKYSVEEHYRRHRAAVSTWRNSVSSGIVETVRITGRHGPHIVDVKALGKDSGTFE